MTSWQLQQQSYQVFIHKFIPFSNNKTFISVKIDLRTNIKYKKKLLTFVS